MATEKQANIAREKHIDYLDSLGCHSIVVEEISLEGKKTFAVIGYVKNDIPKTTDYLEINVEKKICKVPLVVKAGEEFKFE